MFWILTTSTKKTEVYQPIIYKEIVIFMIDPHALVTYIPVSHFTLQKAKKKSTIRLSITATLASKMAGSILLRQIRAADNGKLSR